MIILHLIDLLKFSKQIKTQGEFARRIEMKQSTITKINNGTAHFTVKQIEMICKIFNVNANWIFGLDKRVFNDENSIEIKDFMSPKAS
ncbi:helix-turn-helix transcriptional regulator [Flavobacterium sp. 102]|uniref:helix-turn-helix transcriptional regulator n=1 Tax=Flavobacterium sp. 102 TaxID=2135623 RepID=UPI001313EDED|nr:helix-turn-helix transcriptional regulator [Flavobacterium sp. 102]